MIEPIKVKRVWPYRTAYVANAVSLPRSLFSELEKVLREEMLSDNHIVVEVKEKRNGMTYEYAVWLSDLTAYVGHMTDIRKFRTGWDLELRE